MLEAASHVDTVVFDKTGTLTRGRPSLQQVQLLPTPTPGPSPSLTPHGLLAYAAAVERCTSHPVAQAIVQAADKSGGRERGGEGGGHPMFCVCIFFFLHFIFGKSVEQRMIVFYVIFGENLIKLLPFEMC